jgi:hypothetical protein
MTLEISPHICETLSNIKFYQNPSTGSRVVPCGRTDGHDVANSRFSQSCEKLLIMYHVRKICTVHPVRKTLEKRKSNFVTQFIEGFFTLRLQTTLYRVSFILHYVCVFELWWG